jgi:hypothetical protein
MVAPGGRDDQRPRDQALQEEALQAEVGYLRDRIALLRASLYRRGFGSSPRMQELERELERAEQRLQAQRHARRS